MEYLLSVPQLAGECVVICRSIPDGPLFTHSWIGWTSNNGSDPSVADQRKKYTHTHTQTNKQINMHTYTNINLHFCHNKMRPQHCSEFIHMYKVCVSVFAVVRVSEWVRDFRKKLRLCMNSLGLLICCVDWYLNKLCIRFIYQLKRFKTVPLVRVMISKWITYFYKLRTHKLTLPPQKKNE